MPELVPRVCGGALEPASKLEICSEFPLLTEQLWGQVPRDWSLKPQFNLLDK